MGAADRSTPSTVRNVLLGHAEMAAVLRHFGALVRRDEARLNAINVFPVADSDTGTNLRRTLDLIVDAVSDGQENLTAYRSQVQMAALSGRGNSGLIIGQYLAGFVEILDRPADSPLLADCLSHASNTARHAVVNPVRGTVLTVASAAATEAARRIHLDTPTLTAYVEVAGLGALERTPSQLPVLAAAGVVDSGGAGLVLFFEALAGVLGGRLPIEPTLPLPATTLPVGECRTGLDPIPGPPGIVVGFEVMFRLPAALASHEELRRFLGHLGSDVVVATDGAELAAHLHVADGNVAAGAISAEFETRPGAKAISYDIEPLIVPSSVPSADEAP